MAEPATASLAGHARHDPLRVAEAVDRGARRAAALNLCARCAGLYADLVALTTALPLAALPARPRDFTLSDVDARRLRPRGWRAWWSTLGSARDTLTRPLAIGFATLGLAGLLLTAAPSMLGMAGAAAGPGPAGGIEPYQAAAPQPADATPTTLGVDASAAPREVDVNAVAAEPSSTLMLSVGLLAAAGGLFAVRRVAGHGRGVR